MISHIARKANVSSVPFYEVIEGLTKSGLLTKQTVGKSIFYKTSPTGREFIKKYSDLLLMVRPLLTTSETFMVEPDIVK
jgi:predicted transcriptional regulator